MSLLFHWCTTCLHFLVPLITCSNSEAGAEPEKPSSPALDYPDSSAALDDSDPSVIEFDAKLESPNTHKRQRIRVNLIAITSKPPHARSNGPAFGENIKQRDELS